MGSGETSPTMTTVHRELYDRVGGPAVILDTPVGFQMNASDVSARALEYFATAVQREAAVASFRRADAISALEREQALRALRRSAYVFAGPGSPTYALKQWAGSEVPGLLRAKLREGGCLTFASAAALTVGKLTLPVYEIYKVGEEVRWEKGLDLTAETGLNAVVIPHYNNAEGGTHDTRYCYMGEQRLARLEEMVPADTFILGVDEHTACVIDIDEATARVSGVGGVTIRSRGAETRLAAGETVALHELAAAAGGKGLVHVDHSFRSPGDEGAEQAPAGSPFWDDVAGRSTSFARALETADVDAAVNAMLELHDHLWSWSTESFGTGELEEAKALFREMIARLGEEAAAGPRDPRGAVAPFVDICLRLRDRAREEGRYADADAIRDALIERGIEVRDTPDGTQWTLSTALE